MLARSSLAAYLVVLLAPTASAMPPTASLLLSSAGPAPARGACPASQHRQFDFWLGEWQVHTRAGKYAGRNSITRTLDGCVLQKRWRGAGGHHGTSVNIYDASRNRWHQTWVDDDGLLLQLDGGLVDGQMMLSGETVAADGARVLHRITRTPLNGHKVRQHWQSSKDGGTTWETAFDGIYTPVPR